MTMPIENTPAIDRLIAEAREAGRAEVRAELRSLPDAGWESGVASDDARRLAGSVRLIAGGGA